MRKKNPSIETLIPHLKGELKTLRRELHAIPETALEEFKTKERIMKALEGLPLYFHKPYLGTDIVADIVPPHNPKELIILRADMDGLNMNEETDLPWKSTHHGKMHACGHDGHMAILVGAAKILCAQRESLKKRVRLVFQPGEEMVCAGSMLADAGAYAEGTEAYALHGWPGVEEGTIRTKEGVIMAATDSFSFRFTGKGTHGATPEAGLNPLSAASFFVLKVEELHSKLNQKMGAVISPCMIEGGSSANVIPETCTVQGTTRYLDGEQGKIIEKKLHKIAKNICDAEGYTYTCRYNRAYHLPVINAPWAADKVLDRAQKLFGKGQALRAERHDMMAEDFAFCLDLVEGCFFHLGMGEEWESLHSPHFDFNDKAIEKGVCLFTALAGGSCE